MTKGDYIILAIKSDADTVAPVALCTDNTMEIDVDMIEVAASESAGDKEFVPGRYSWKLTSSHLVGKFNYQTLHDAQKNHTELTVLFHQEKDEPNAFSICGKAYISSFKMSAPLRNLATADVEWQGTGSFDIDTYSGDRPLIYAGEDTTEYDRFTFNNWQ